jgi:ActR/RegA family two-component response regulator
MAETNSKSKLILLECDATTATRFTRAASKLYDVIGERDAKQAVERISADAGASVFVAGTAAGGESVLNVLASVKTARLDVLRVSLTDPADLGCIIEGLHSGIIERTIQKPFEGQEVLTAITLPSRLAMLSAIAGTGAPAARRAS